MKNNRLISLGLWLALVINLIGQPVHAVSDQALIQLLKVLHEDGTLNDAKFQAIMQLVESDSAEAPTIEANPTAQVAKQEKAKGERATTEIDTSKTATPKIASASMSRSNPAVGKIINNGKLEMHSPDGDFKVRLGGRLMVDGAIYNDDISALGSGAEIRRARLYMSGTMWRSWQYKLQYDFINSGTAGIRDAFIQYSSASLGAIRLGHFKEPFSKTNMSSSKHISFIERGLPHLFTPGRSIGVSYTQTGENWGLIAGLFADGVDTPLGEVDQGYAITARGNFAPIYDKGERALHLGTSYSYRHLDDNHRLRFRSQPETHITNVRLIDTGFFNAESLHRYNLEAMWIQGPFALQGEYYYTDVKRADDKLRSLAFDGYYIEASWFLTGESMNYNPKKGIQGKITPHHNLGADGFGAWQMMARFSTVDLNDKDIRGGQEDNFSLGMIWYPNPNLRFWANYVKVLDIDGGPNPHDRPDFISLRAQAAF